MTKPNAGQPSAPARLAAAWQPLTPGGVAAFSGASPTRLLLVQTAVASLFAGVLIWFLYVACLPVLHEAASRLPEEGRIEQQVLRTPHTQSTPLAESRILAVAVDLHEESRSGLTSDFLLELHAADFEICSLLGCLVFPYPKNWVIEVNRKNLEPWWDAWKPVLLTVLVLLVLLSLIVIWSLLATLYCPVPWFIAYYSDRRLTLPGAWRLSAAALMPGAFVIMLALIAYALGTLDLIRTVILMALHFVVGWIYLVASPWWLPRVAEAVAETVILKENPFTPPPPPPPAPEPESAAEPDQPKNPNPFAAPTHRDKTRETDRADSAS